MRRLKLEADAKVYEPSAFLKLLEAENETE